MPNLEGKSPAVLVLYRTCRIVVARIPQFKGVPGFNLYASNGTCWDKVSYPALSIPKEMKSWKTWIDPCIIPCSNSWDKITLLFRAGPNQENSQLYTATAERTELPFQSFQDIRPFSRKEIDPEASCMSHFYAGEQGYLLYCSQKRSDGLFGNSIRIVRVDDTLAPIESSRSLLEPGNSSGPLQLGSAAFSPSLVHDDESGWNLVASLNKTVTRSGMLLMRSDSVDEGFKVVKINLGEELLGAGEMFRGPVLHKDLHGSGSQLYVSKRRGDESKIVVVELENLL